MVQWRRQELIDASTMVNPRPHEEVEAVIQFSTPTAVSDETQFFIEELNARTRQTQNFMGEWGDACEAKAAQSPIEDEYSEQMVAAERRESIARMTKIGKLAAERDLAFQRIMNTVRDQEREHPYEHLHREDPEMCPPSPSASSRGPSARLYKQSAAPRYGSHQPETREVNARVVAEKLQRKHARTENFNRNRKKCRAEQENHHKAICSALENADRLSERRQMERAHLLAEKIYHQQQKHSDQKKMLHEIQRDQERSWDLLQQKNYAHQMRRPSSSPALLRNKKTHEPEMQESVYSDMEKSHSLYKTTVKNWQEMEADNERRNEALWLEKLPGGKQAKEERDDPDKTPAQKVKRAANKITGAARLVRANSLESNSPDARFTLRTPPSEASEVDFGEETCMDTSPRSQWELRMERCREWQKKQEAELIEKRAKDAQRLEHSVQRSREETLNRAQKAQYNLSNWLKKAEVAAERRKPKNKEAEYFAKKEQKRLVRTQTIAFETEIRDQNQAVTSAVREATLQRKKTVQLTENERRKEALDMKDSKTLHNVQSQLEDFENRSPTAKTHAEEARVKIETKQAYENEFRKKAQEAILEKESRKATPVNGRQTLQVSRTTTPVNGRQTLQVRSPDSSTEANKLVGMIRRQTKARQTLKRLTRKSEKPPLSPTELALSDLQPLAVILTPSHNVPLRPSISQRQLGASDYKEVEGVLEKAINTSPRVDPTLMAKKSPRVEPEGQREADVDLSRPRSSNSRVASKTSNPRAASKQQAGLSNTASPRGAKRLSDPKCDDSGSSADEEFLQELQTRSSKWLHEAMTRSASSFFL